MQSLHVTLNVLWAMMGMPFVEMYFYTTGQQHLMNVFMQRNLLILPFTVSIAIFSCMFLQTLSCLTEFGCCVWCVKCDMLFVLNTKMSHWMFYWEIPLWRRSFMPQDGISINCMNRGCIYIIIGSQISVPNTQIQNAANSKDNKMRQHYKILPDTPSRLRFIPNVFC